MNGTELDYITVKGFKSIASVERLVLGPINVLVGPNGSGKSNFVGVFSFLHAIREGRLQDYVRKAGGAVDPASWLRNLYTNESGQMICQICKKEMPFKKRDGEYYFEVVEALSGDHFRREYEAQFVALCPLCSAMYKEFVKNDPERMDALKGAIVTSQVPEVNLHLGEKKTSVKFVESHFHDIKTIIGQENEWRHPPASRQS